MAIFFFLSPVFSHCGKRLLCLQKFSLPSGFFFSTICFLIKSKTNHCNPKMSQIGKKNQHSQVAFGSIPLKEIFLEVPAPSLICSHPFLKVSWLCCCWKAQCFTLKGSLISCKKWVQPFQTKQWFPPADEENRLPAQ